MSELVRSLPGAGSELRVVLSDDAWRLIVRSGGTEREVFAVDPGLLAARLLNRDLRELPGASRPESKEATARRIADANASAPCPREPCPG
ncbi:MAG TPA: hypothetical protein VHT91_29170 [Kofleriaceae bacterium]|jgi:hypothetical protein|nr:hypothetical protein [Kofleriaceae bacterium]